MTAADPFATQVLKCAPELRAFVGRRVPEPAVADDLLQDVFVKVFRARGSLRDAGRLRAWLFQSTRAAMADHYRRRRPLDPLPPDLQAECAESDDPDGAMSRAVRRFLLTLPETYRRPLELVDLGRLPLKRAAQELGIGESAIKNRLSRGRAMLGKKMLDCCRLELGSSGEVLDYSPRHAPLPAPPAGLTFALARPEDEPGIRDLLERSGLVTSDLTPAHFLTFLVARAGRKVVGCVGGEVLDERTLLLRSLAVEPARRDQGIGARLVAEGERVAVQLGIGTIYLLTTSASEFFARQGFRVAPREVAPEVVRRSSQFAALCPASAVLLLKAPQISRPSPAAC